MFKIHFAWASAEDGSEHFMPFSVIKVYNPAMQDTTLYVTGVGGFVGQAARKFLQVHSVQAPQLLESSPTEIDLFDKRLLKKTIQSLNPDYIIHLAALSSVAASFSAPRDTFDVNFYGTLNLLEVLAELKFTGRLLYIGSGDEYGLVKELDFPIVETMPLRPRNPYAVSKVAAEALCYQWSQSMGLDIVMARSFNHIGPGQSDRFVISAFAKQIIEIKLQLRAPIIVVGNLNVTRDFTDVEDVVKAYLLLLEKGCDGEVYNICSGQEYMIKDILTQLLRLAGVKADIQIDDKLIRPVEQTRIVASNAKLRKITGWSPKILLEQTLAEVLNYWEEKLANG